MISEHTSQAIRSVIIPENIFLSAISILLLFCLYAVSQSNYLLFHGVVELASIVVAFTIFVIVWNTRRAITNTFFLVIGISFLFTGGIDLVHMLAYKGMGVFPGNSSDLPTQLWIAARYFQVTAFLIATLLIGKSITKERKYDAGIIFTVCAAAFCLLMASIFLWQNFPHCYIDGVGLTPFKITSEYIISAIFVVTIIVLALKRDAFDPVVWHYLVAALAFLIVGELAFTSYVSVFGFMNMLGHLAKLISVYFLYRAIVVIAIARPFDLLFSELKHRSGALQESEERYRNVVEDQTEFICRFHPDGTHLFVNDAYCRYFGKSQEDIIGHRFRPVIHPADMENVADHISSITVEHPVRDIDQRTIMPDGSIRWQRWSDRGIFGENGMIIEYQSVGRDTTDAKEVEASLRESEQTIRNLLNAVPDDLALINQERTIIAVNESMAETLGQPPEALTGRAVGDFLTSSVLSETIDRIIDPHTMSGQVYFEEKQDDRWLETSVYPVTDRNSTDVRIAIQSRDITDRKYLEEELKKAGLSQVELNIEKFQILNDQIRNPLQVIRGYLALDPGEYHDEINKQVEIIDNIVTELDMGWLESEKVQQFLIKHSHCPTLPIPGERQAGVRR